jgi:hypothetical protein
MLQRFLSGEFHVAMLGPETWLATNRRRPGESVLLRHVRASAPLGASTVADSVTVTWQAGGPVAVDFSIEGRILNVTAGTVFVHEPAPRVYAGLPLPAFTPGMRRFWRRVFGLVRIPGGRLILGWLSRRSRGPA